MPPRRHRGRAWRRPTKQGPPAVDYVLEQLKKRRLRSLDECRLAWERSADPLAVCVAITKTPGLPDWLADAVLAFLFEAAGAPKPHKTFLAKAWARRFQDDVDARRALETAMARTHPSQSFTWEQSFELAEFFARVDGERRSPAVAKKSYQLLQRRLEENPGRYYSLDNVKAIAARRETALERLLRIVEAEATHEKE